MKKRVLKEYILNNKLDQEINYINCGKNLEIEKKRYLNLLEKAYSSFGDQDFKIYSAPGRSEIGGNHTDHQQGRVLAAAVNMDVVAVTCEDKDFVEFISEGYKIEKIAINDLTLREAEFNTSESLIRGILAKFKLSGYEIGGFKCYSNSNVLRGSGISSSAAFEVLVATILNDLYNDNKISPIEIAQISQYAENVYFNKPSGLLDQMGCSVGNFVAIDFRDLKTPIVEKINFDFANSGLNLVLVDTKGDHAELSDEYGMMPKEMKEVANYFNKDVLLDVTLEDVISNTKNIRKVTSDRAILRAIHFINETARVVTEVNALKNNNIDEFLNCVIESGYSSYMYLQNVYSPNDYLNQELSLALCISEQLLKGKRGAYRVHGGGLAGTIQAFVPDELLNEYTSTLDSIFGEGSCKIISIRPVGGYRLV